MNNNIQGVITGDIVASSRTELNFKEVLERIALDIQEFQDPEFRLEIYRGDSFQALIKDPTQGLNMLLIIKSGLRRYTTRKESSSIVNIMDARLSLGIGETKGANNKPLGEHDGDAFTRSGRTLEKMKSEGSLLKITTGDGDLDDEFATTCLLLDAIISRWSTAQAQAIYLYLLKKITQGEIGKDLGISQRAVGKRLETSNIDHIIQFNERFRKRITWKFNN